MPTAVKKKIMAPNIFLTLTVRSSEAILELNPKSLNEDDGLTNLYETLDLLFKEDSSISALLAYELFENYVRPNDKVIRTS